MGASMVLLDCKSKSSIESSLMNIFGITKKKLDEQLNSIPCINELTLREAGMEIVKGLDRVDVKPLNIKWFHGTCLTKNGRDSVNNNGLFTRSEVAAQIKHELKNLSVGIEHRGSKQPCTSVTTKRDQGNEGPFAYLINLDLTSDSDDDYSKTPELIQDYAIETVGVESSDELIAKYKEQCIECDVIFKSNLSFDKAIIQGILSLSESENDAICDAAGVLKFLEIDRHIETSKLFVFEGNATIPKDQIFDIVQTSRQIEPPPNIIDTSHEPIVSSEVLEIYQ
jgi:hypothetical protein